MGASIISKDRWLFANMLYETEDVIRFGTTNSSFLLCGSADRRLKGSEEATHAEYSNLKWKDVLEVSTALSLIPFFSTMHQA